MRILSAWLYLLSRTSWRARIVRTNRGACPAVVAASFGAPAVAFEGPSRYPTKCWRRSASMARPFTPPDSSRRNAHVATGVVPGIDAESAMERADTDLADSYPTADPIPLRRSSKPPSAQAVRLSVRKRVSTRPVIRQRERLSDDNPDRRSASMRFHPGQRV
jgi:hypothetical protein